MSPKRPGTAADRDVLVRKDTSPQGVPVVAEDEVTGRYEGDELRERRSRRSTDQRAARLEDKHDALAEVVGDVRVEVGKLKVESDDHGKKLDKIDQKLDLIVAGRVEFGRRVWLALIGGGGVVIWALQHFWGGR